MPMPTAPFASIALLAVLSHVYGTTPSAAPPCDAAAPHTPRSFDVTRELRAHVERLIEQSATFRAQCRRVADAKGVVVRVRLNPGLDPHRLRARSVISRLVGGGLMVRVELSPWGDPEEWLAHEFEHIVEQLERVPLPTLAERGAGVWRVGENLYETSRAIDAGRRVRGELRRHRARYDRNVE
jgi:hypothetical protein